MLHARSDYNRIQDPAVNDPSLLSEGSTPIAADEPVFLVRASDQAFKETLLAWIAAHRNAGGCPMMAEAVEAWIDKAIAWQSDNHRCKIADAPESVFSI